MTRLALLASLVLALASSTTSRAADRPAAGAAVPGYGSVDKAVTDFMDQVGASAATVAVFADGKMAYSRGFGWRDKARKTPTKPDDLMRVASVSKPVTAALVRGLARDGKLSLDDKAFATLGLLPPAGGKGDPRLADVTVRHLLDHQGGWDRAEAGDPMFKVRQIETALKLTRPAGPADVVRYMATQPLQFAPGERKAYSNFGYCVLGRVVEKAAGKPYADVLRERVADPLKVADGLKVGRGRRAERDPREVEYPVRDDAFALDVMDAHGGLIASAPALGKFLSAYWVSGEPRKPGEKGYRYTFFGSLPGTTAMVLQRLDGRDVAVLLNARRDASFEKDDEALQKAVVAAVDAVPARPADGR